MYTSIFERVIVLIAGTRFAVNFLFWMALTSLNSFWKR
jgi:hypothetical protein